MDNEILEDLKNLSLRGHIKAVGNGTNSVGKTLQSALGISHKTTKKNQYKGFIITSTTLKAGSRTNLFGLVPDWKNSLITSSTELVKKHGVDDNSGKYKKKLFCTVKAKVPNSFGLMLRIDRRKRTISEIHSKEGRENEIVQWDTLKLESKLKSLDKSIIVTASSHKKNDGLYYHYQIAEFLKKPTFEKFLQQIEFGSITMDHLISLHQKRKTAREQGPLFKIAKHARMDLYENYKKFNLMD
tara:strand:- start:2387 stop:3112 length:726 start_codon:yes stop_codon:yes gene_type:complete